MPTRHSSGWRLVDAVCVDPKQVHIVWPEVSHWIRRAFQRGDLGRFGDCEQDVLNGRSLLWLIWNEPRIEGAAVTQIYETENSLVCEIRAYGGDGFRTELVKRVEDYARAEGCDVVRIFGRKGWLRVLRDYTAPKIILEKRL